MRTFEITEEQILQLSKNAKNESYQLILADLKSWFTQQIETHRWYVVSHPSENDAIVFLQENGMRYTHGFNHYCNWTDIYSNDHLHSKYNNDIVRLATADELKKVLTDEAVRRGVWNKPMVSVSGLVKYNDCGFAETYDYEKDALWSSYGKVYEGGYWATPILEGIIEDRLSRIEKHLGL